MGMACWSLCCCPTIRIAGSPSSLPPHPPMLATRLRDLPAGSTITVPYICGRGCEIPLLVLGHVVGLVSWLLLFMFGGRLRRKKETTNTCFAHMSHAKKWNDTQHLHEMALARYTSISRPKSCNSLENPLFLEESPFRKRTLPFWSSFCLFAGSSTLWQDRLFGFHGQIFRGVLRAFNVDPIFINPRIFFWGGGT